MKQARRTKEIKGMFTYLIDFEYDFTEDKASYTMKADVMVNRENPVI